MTWAPNATVTVGGTAYTNDVLWNASISYGRSNVWEQARAGYATVEILNLTDTNHTFEVNDELVITLQDSNGDPVTVFTGNVTNIESTVSALGTSGEAIIERLTAVAPFAFMARKIVGTSGYPKEYDDDRITNILTEAGVTIDVVDTPGVYEFTAMAHTSTDAYSLASKYAQMALGYIYETPDGKVGYANESHRLNDVQDNGYFNIPPNYILAAGLSSNSTLNDIANDIILSYKANATVTATDASSIAIYGRQAASIATELEQGAQAQFQIDRYIALRAYAQTSLSSFTVQLDSSFVSGADLDVFLNMYMGKPITITGLPIPIIHTVYQGFVEGWILTFNQYQAAITLTTTDTALSIPPTRWQDVSPTQRWVDVSGTVQWPQYE